MAPPANTAREHRQPRREDAFAGVEQVPAPLHDRAERLVAGHRRTAPGGEQAEPVAAPFGDLPGRQRAEPGGGQFDGERHAVELAADALDGVALAVHEVAGPYGGRPLGEQPYGVVCAERPDRPQPLTGDAERLPAGGEDAQAGALGEEPVGEHGGGLGHVLAVVQHEQRVARRQSGDEPGHRVGLPARPARHGGHGAHGHQAGVAQAERGEGGLHHLRRVVDRRELDQPHAAGHPRGDRLGRLHRQPRLARPARAEQRDEAVGGEERADPADVVVPADEAGQPGPQVAPARGTRRRLRDGGSPLLHPGKSLERGGETRGRPGVLPGGLAPQHREVELGQRGRGVGPEPVGEHRPGLFEGGERLDPAARPIKSTHELPVRPFPERVGRDEQPQLRDQVRVPAQGRLGLDPVLRRRLPQLLQPGHLDLGVRQVGQRSAAPQPECLTQQGGGAARIARGQRRGALPRQAGEPMEVHLIGGDGQAIAGRPAGHQVTADRGPQPGRQRLQGVPHAARRAVVPHPRHERLGGDGAAGVQQQERQQGSQPPPADLDRPPVAPYVEGAQNGEAHARSRRVPLHA